VEDIKITLASLSNKVYNSACVFDSMNPGAYIIA